MENVPATSGSPGKAKARKRLRTAVACRRCKTRKQKCNGVSPKCANCSHSESECHYDVNPSLQRSQEQYMKARRRVSELEGILSQLGDVRDRVVPSPSPSIAATSTSPPNSAAFAGQGNLRDDDLRHSVQAEGFSPALRRETSGSGEAVDVLQTLSLAAAGGYVNSSSTAALGRMLQAVAASRRTQPSTGSPGGLLDQDLTPKSLESVTQPAGPGHISLVDIPDVIADRMLEKGYFNYIATLWPVMHPKRLRKLHAERAHLEDRFDVAALHLVYAAAGRFLETTGETGSFRSEKHYQSAVRMLDDILALPASVKTIQILLLLAIYSLRSPKGPGAWSFIGMAMRMCIESGLHRKRKALGNEDPQHEDLLRRVFWSCYTLDRQCSIVLGRPFAVADRDIDAPLPCETDEDGDGSMACFVHICRLRIIESHIQQSVYRVDEPASDHLTSAGLPAFISQLEDWRSNIPSNGESRRSIENYDSYLIYYYQACRFLLHPHITSCYAQDQYLLRAVTACGGICSTYKRLHQNVTVGFSLMALHSVFTAGITMLYAVWKAPTLVLSHTTRNMINDCSIVLYIITERWPGAKRYRDLFEGVKEPTLATIERNQGQSKTSIDPLEPDVYSTLGTMASTKGQADFSEMLMEMSGDQLPHAGQTGTLDNSSTATENTVDLDFMPGLAFDFSMPEPSQVYRQLQQPLNLSSSEWYSEYNMSSNAWDTQQGMPRSW